MQADSLSPKPAILVPGRAPCFPDPVQALAEPNGLLALGGELSVDWLLTAYRSGIFPWFEEGDPIIWWSPDPRAVLYCEQVHVSRSLRKSLRRQRFQLSVNRAFAEVIDACASVGERRDATWIGAGMRQAYQALHQRGHAHSVEVWLHGELVGGLYGVAVGRLFCGESMFFTVADASKTALLTLCMHLQRRGWPVVDCQMMNPHLRSLGAIELPRDRFMDSLARLAQHQGGPLFAPGLDWSCSRELEAALA